MNIFKYETIESQLLPRPFTVEGLRQSSNELSAGAQVALESCIGAWKVISYWQQIIVVDRSQFS